MTRRCSLCLTAAACIVAVVVGCARQESLPTAATEVILPGEEQLTPPQQAAAPVAEPAATPAVVAAPVESPTAAPAETTAAAPEVATARPAAAQPAPAAKAVTESTGSELAAFRGRVSVDGPVANFSPLKGAGDPTVQDKACVAVAIPDESVIVSADGGLADVFVFAKKLPAGVKAPPPPTEPAVLDQQACRFVPQAMVLRAGQPLLMKNSDPVAHNVRTSALGMSINQIITPNNTTGLPVTYKKAERVPVQTRCDIHAWMLAWHFPLEHPWGAVTDANGNFTIPDLPPGDWEFVIWHGKVGNIERSFKFTATAGQALTQEFSVPATKLSQ